MPAKQVADALLASTPNEECMQALDGCWELVFTTGTSGFSFNSYFPLKAQQCFDFASSTLSNGIYAGDTPVLQFSGEFTVKGRKLDFTFDKVKFLAWNFDVNSNDRGFFIWIDVDDTIAAARGAGGGLALWKRVT